MLQNRATIVHFFAKRDLFDASLSPDETERQRIEVEGKPVAMNTFSLLLFLEDWEEVSSDSEEEVVCRGWYGWVWSRMTFGCDPQRREIVKKS